MTNLGLMIQNAVVQGNFVIEDSETSLSSDVFEQHAVRLCTGLQNQAKPRQAVIVLIANRPSDLVAYYAVWKAGMVVVPVHKSSPQPVLQTIVSSVCAPLIIDGGSISETGLKEEYFFSPATAFVIFTSGSTGNPKGVVIGHEQFAGKLQTLIDKAQLTSSDISVLPLQLTFIFGIWVSLISLLSGSRLRLLSKFSPLAMKQAMSDDATIATAVPSMFRTMLASTEAFPASIRIWFTGGEPLGADLGNRVQAFSPSAAIMDMYGSTETGSCDFCFDSKLHVDGFGTIGRAMPGVEFRIISDGMPVADGQSGELEIKTKYGMSGYHANAQLTANVFNEKFYKTGDLARMRSDGFLEITGRVKDIISRGGNKVAPLELDFLFASHPDVEAALSVGIPDERLGETIHIMIVPKSGAKPDEAKLREWASERIERFKLPDGMYFVDELPVGKTGKADRKGAFQHIQSYLSR